MNVVTFKISAILVALVLLMLVVGKLGKRHGWQSEVQRKILHVGLGSSALTFPWFFDQSWQVVLSCAVGGLILLAVRSVPFLRRNLGHGLHNVNRSSFGELYFAGAISLLFGLAQGEKSFYVVSLAILTFADSSAALAGKRWGKRRFKVIEGQKSWEGVAVFGVVAFIVTVAGLCGLTTLPISLIVTLATTLAIFAALIEAIAWRGLDNLLIPLGSFVFLEGLHEWDGVILLYQLALLGGLIALASARQSKLSPHALMLWVLAVYSILIGGTLLWFAALVCVLLCHYLWTQLWNEWGSDAFGLPVGFPWLSLGRKTADLG